jgi:hypothetical protein
VISNKEYTALIIVSASWVYFVPTIAWWRRYTDKRLADRIKNQSLRVYDTIYGQSKRGDYRSKQDQTNLIRKKAESDSLDSIKD